MLTFEKILKVFQAYLDDDPLYEVVQTSHGYTCLLYTSVYPFVYLRKANTLRCKLFTFHKSDYPIREVILSQSTIAAVRLSAGGKANLP